MSMACMWCAICVSHSMHRLLFMWCLCVSQSTYRCFSSLPCFFSPPFLSHSLIIELVLSLVRVGSLLGDTETSQVYRTPRYSLSPSLAPTPPSTSLTSSPSLFASLSHTHTHTDADKLSSLQPNASPFLPRLRNRGQRWKSLQKTAPASQQGMKK